ncbi:MAG TPA: aspartyl protease family protein [Bryobacteraceae bacterium]|nr:aspartyl protease family protein [Bryobacteraceae bacterium]
MKEALCTLLIASACVACAWAGDPVENTLASGRKALLNEGVATAWRLSQKALADAPESAAAHEFAGEVLFRRGQIANAEAEFKRATKLDPNFARAWWGLARIAACESLDKTADQYYRRAHDLDPRDSKIFLDWAMRLKGAEHIDALETYASVTDPNREQPEVDRIREHIRLDKSLRGRKLTALVSSYEKTEIPLLALVTSSQTRTFGVEVDVNGTKLKLVLDTGAGGFVIQRSAAQRAGVEHLVDVALNGFGDNAKLRSAYTGLAAHVGIGGVVFQNALVNVSNQEFTDIQDGLIGTNVFSQFLVTIDFAARKLKLDPLPGYRPDSEESLDAAAPADMQGWTRFYQFGHLLLIPTRVGESREALFVIDTGAARTLISYDMAAEVSKLDRDEKLGLHGINGRVADVYQAGDLYLQFAGFRQRNQAMTSFDMWPQSRGIGVEISGFLGLPVLSLFTITIDYRDGLVKFDYKG